MQTRTGFKLEIKHHYHHYYHHQQQTSYPGFSSSYVPKRVHVDWVLIEMHLIFDHGPAMHLQENRERKREEAEEWGR